MDANSKECEGSTLTFYTICPRTKAGQVFKQKRGMPQNYDMPEAKFYFSWAMVVLMSALNVFNCLTGLEVSYVFLFAWLSFWFCWQLVTILLLLLCTIFIQHWLVWSYNCAFYISFQVKVRGKSQLVVLPESQRMNWIMDLSRSQWNSASSVSSMYIIASVWVTTFCCENKIFP